MLFEPKTVLLKDGRTAVLRPPAREDGGPMLDVMRRISGETPFILRNPEEWDDVTVEWEESFLDGRREDPSMCFIVAEVDGKIAGNCCVAIHLREKVRHRASVAISLLRDYWNLGLGTALFERMIETAKGWGCTQLELEFVEGNTRARALYEKMGFAIVGVKPDAIRLKDGTLLREYSMIRKL